MVIRVIRLGSGSSILVTKFSRIATFTNTFPWVVTAPIFATWIRHTFFTCGPSPTYMAPTFMWVIAKTSCCVAIFSAFGFVAEMTFESVVANTFHGFGAVPMFGTARELDANVAIWT